MASPSSPNDIQELSINDPVVTSPSNHQGIISFMGSVSFADGNDWVGVRLTGTSIGKGRNDGSVDGVKYFDAGTGKNKNGVFVRQSQITKRNLTKLEQLRLKRELRSVGGNDDAGAKRSGIVAKNRRSTAVGSGKLPKTSPSSLPRLGNAKNVPSTVTDDSHNNFNTDNNETADDEVSMVSMSDASMMYTRSNRSRLDEIRERRMPLTHVRAAGTSTPGKADDISGGLKTELSSTTSNEQPSSPTTGTATTNTFSFTTSPSISSSPTNIKNAGSTPSSPTSFTAADMETLREKIRARDMVQDRLNLRLSTAEKATRDAVLAKEDAESALTVVRQKLRAAEGRGSDYVHPDDAVQHGIIAGGTAATDESGGGGASAATEVAVRSLTAEVSELRRRNESLADGADSARRELSCVKDECETLRIETANANRKMENLHQSNTEDKRELDDTNGIIHDLKRRLTLKESMEDNRGVEAKEALRERVKLEAKVTSLTRSLETFKERDLHNDTAIEEFALEREMLEERLEEMEDSIEELKIDSESAVLELEECKEELVEVRERADNLEGELTLVKSRGVEVAGAGSNTAKNNDNDGDDAAIASATATISSTSSNNNNNNTADVEDVVRSVTVQNSRLREAILRLREQTSHERVEHSRLVRDLTKNSNEVDTLRDKVKLNEKLTNKHVEEIDALKLAVDEQGAWGTMVEELSDRNMTLEDQILELKSEVHELEMGSELNGEYEEEMEKEIKLVTRMLDTRDNVIITLERAIKMQRRREEDYQKTLSNYRSSVEKLRKEKSSLLAMQRGGEGDMSSLLASSQRAMAQAAQLVADATASRKRDAIAAVRDVDAKVQGALAERLGMFLPRSVASGEVAAVRGELMLSRVALKASIGLRDLESSLAGRVRNGAVKVKEIVAAAAAVAATTAAAAAANNDNGSGNDAVSGTLGTIIEEDEEEKSQAKQQPPPPPPTLILPDFAAEEIQTMVHQTRFSLLAVSTSSDAMHVLAAGQWPDLLTPEQSAELGCLAGRTVGGLDATLLGHLTLLKEEGRLSPHRSNLATLEQGSRNARAVLLGGGDYEEQKEKEKKKKNEKEEGEEGDVGDDKEDGTTTVIPRGWSPPGLEALKSAASARFACLGAAASLAVAIVPPEDEITDNGTTSVLCVALGSTVSSLDRICTEASTVGARLARLDVPAAAVGEGDGGFMHDITALASQWMKTSITLFEFIASRMLSNGNVTQSDISECESFVDCTTLALGKLTSRLRSACPDGDGDSNTFGGEELKDGKGNVSRVHALSPETLDPWLGITDLVNKVRNVKEVDGQDINYLTRARTLEGRFSTAIENNAKLSIASARVGSLEKSLAMRNKEVALQNSRLSELEHLLMQTDAASAVASTTPVNDGISHSKSSNVPSEEVGALKEEIIVLSEAMEVMQTQVGDYESEIRLLKDPHRPKTAGKRRKSITTPSINGDDDFSLSSLGIGLPHSKGAGYDSFAKTISLEAALFRPALRAAQLDAAKWKIKTISDIMSNLPPLSSKLCEIDFDSKLSICSERLLLAKSEVLMSKAAVSVVKLDNIIISSDTNHNSNFYSRGKRVLRSRIQLREEIKKTSAATERLKEASCEATHELARLSFISDNHTRNPSLFYPTQDASTIPPKMRGRMLGKITIVGKNPKSVLPLLVKRSDLRQLHTTLLQ